MAKLFPVDREGNSFRDLMRTRLFWGFQKAGIFFKEVHLQLQRTGPVGAWSGPVGASLEAFIMGLNLPRDICERAMYTGFEIQVPMPN